MMNMKFQISKAVNYALSTRFQKGINFTTNNAFSDVVQIKVCNNKKPGLEHEWK